MAVWQGSTRLASGAKGVVVIEWRGDEVLAEVDSMVSQRLNAAAVMVVDEAQASFGRTKSGKPGPSRRRSAPGEAPANQLETLRNSISHDAPDQLTRRVGTNLDYGLFLELGTRTMAARPWLEVALWACADKIKRMFRK